MRQALLLALLLAAAAACTSAETCATSGVPPSVRCKKIEVCCSDTLCRYIVSLDTNVIGGDSKEFRCDRNPMEDPHKENGMETTQGRDCTRTATAVTTFCNAPS